MQFTHKVFAPAAPCAQNLLPHDHHFEYLFSSHLKEEAFPDHPYKTALLLTDYFPYDALFFYAAPDSMNSQSLPSSFLSSPFSFPAFFLD